jgi:hypothetical protein
VPIEARRKFRCATDKDHSQSHVTTAHDCSRGFDALTKPDAREAWRIDGLPPGTARTSAAMAATVRDCSRPRCRPLRNIECCATDYVARKSRTPHHRPSRSPPCSSEESIRRKARDGTLPAIRLGYGPRAPLRFDEHELANWLARGSVHGGDAARAPSRLPPPPALYRRLVVPYNRWLEVNNSREGHFMERFLPGSLRKSFGFLRRVKGYFDHGVSRTFDRAPVMEIKDTWETDSGAFFRAALLDGIPLEPRDYLAEEDWRL